MSSYILLFTLWPACALFVVLFMIQASRMSSSIEQETKLELEKQELGKGKL